MEDYNVASDFICDTASKGIHNAHLDAVLHNCGIGLCGSMRIRLTSHLSMELPLTLVMIQRSTSFQFSSGRRCRFQQLCLEWWKHYSNHFCYRSGNLLGNSGRWQWLYLHRFHHDQYSGCCRTIHRNGCFTLSPNPASHQLVITGNEVFVRHFNSVSWMYRAEN